MSTDKTVRIHWMRHALSCKAILQILENLGYEKKIDYKGDSKISDYGKDLASKIKNKKITDRQLISHVFNQIGKLKSPTVSQDLSTYLFTSDETKIILTSNEKRTIETAIYSFGHLPRVNIIPVPYIGAKKSAENFTKLDDLKNYFKNFFETDEVKKYFKNGGENKLSYGKIRWSFLEQQKIEGNDPSTEVSNDKFDREILPKIISDYSPKDAIQRVYNAEYSPKDAIQRVYDAEYSPKDAIQRVYDAEYSPNNIVIISHTEFITARMGRNCPKINKINYLEIIDEIYNYEIVNKSYKKYPSKWNCDISKINPQIGQSEKEIQKNIATNVEDYDFNNTFENCNYPSIYERDFYYYILANPVKMKGFISMFDF